MCSGPSWKREIVPDHKFDFIDTREFTDNGFGMRMKYLWLYIIVLKSFLVYVSDIFTAVTMLTTKSWTNPIVQNCPRLEGCVAIPFNVGRWLFVGCIIFSFLLMAYEARKARKIIASRDISYAFTNVMANNYYSLRSYDHFCFFDHISQSTKTSDNFAFFIFFTFKSWKRVLLADGPRQVINALTLYAIFLAHKNDGPWYKVSKYFAGNTLITSALTISTLFTVLIFAGSLLLLLVAGVCYIPLLCHIKGNLKEYCCHKVDKRIAEIIKRRNKQRLAKAADLARKEAAGDFSHLMNKKGELVHKPLPQPTLPNISLDDDFDDRASIHSRGPSPSLIKGDYYPADNKSAVDYPPMPAYNQPYSHHQNPSAYAYYNPSAATLQDEPPYDDDYGSTAHLAIGGAPYAHHSDTATRDATNSGYVADPYDVYSGHTAATGHVAQHQDAYQYQHQYQYSHQQVDEGGLVYDDPSQGYSSTAQYAQSNNLYTRQPEYGHRSPSPSNGRGYDNRDHNRGGSGGQSQFHAM